MKNFFVSYNKADRQWAEWIAWHLEEAGYKVEIQAWDSQAGKNFIEWMDQASKNTEQTIAVLSPVYFTGKFSKAEWTAALYEEKLLPIRVQDFDIKGLLGPISYIDLVGLDEEEAQDKLLEDVKLERKKPLTAPRFPESIKHTITKPARFPGGLPSIWNVPFKRNSFFTGREEILDDLHKKIVSSQLQALCGLGGIGKTQTIVEYAYRFCNEYDAVLWVVADTKESLFSNFVALADNRILDLPEQEADDQQEICDAVNRWLKEHTNWLLIFDNADNPDILKDYIPYNPEGHILLTSRAQIFDQLGIVNPVEIIKMSPDEAQKFLIKRTGRIDVSDSEFECIKQLAAELDYLPLALEQTAAYITKNKSLFDNYLMSYNKRGLKLLEKSAIDPDKYPRSVATTWLMSFEQVENAFKATADLFRASVFFHPDRIPLEVITAGKDELGSNISEALADYDSDPVVLDELMEPLTQYSLIHRDIQSQTYDIHRLVQVVYRDLIDEDTQHQWAERAVRALNQAFPTVDFSTWNLCKRLLPHAQICAEHVVNLNFQFTEASRLLGKTASYLHDRARYKEAELLLRRVLEISEAQQGNDHFLLASSLNRLAGVLQIQGKFAEAEQLYHRSRHIYEINVGKDHPFVGTCLHNLSLLHQIQGKYAEAESLSRKALEITEAYREKDHLDLATSLNRLAGVLQAQGKYAEAEPYTRKALEIRETQLEMNHPLVASSLKRLGEVLHGQDKYVEAEQLYRRARNIYEFQLGEDHPDVAIILRNLAGVLNAQGMYAESESLSRGALEIFETKLGKDHSLVPTALNNLAKSLHAQGKYAEAETMYRQALGILEVQLGKDHPSTEIVRNNLKDLLDTIKTSKKNKKK